MKTERQMITSNVKHEQNYCMHNIAFQLAQKLNRYSYDKNSTQSSPMNTQARPVQLDRPSEKNNKKVILLSLLVYLIIMIRQPKCTSV